MGRTRSRRPLTPLDGRVALVTGGSRGIGRAIALALAQDGADVVITYRRDAPAAEETVGVIRSSGRQALALRADTADEAACDEVVNTTIRHFRTLDILVHNAGTASRGRPVAETERAEVESLLQVHAVGPHHLTSRCLPHLRAAGRSDVVFISSIAADRFAPGQAPYTMAKLAMEGLARTLAKEEARHGVRVNVVAPGLVAATEMGRRFAEASGHELEQLDRRVPFGRITRPEDVAAVVRFLVGPGGDHVTGQRIAVHGGT